MAQYFDLSGDRPMENVQKRLKILTQKLSNSLDPRNKIEHTVPWDDKGLRVENETHAKYLEEMCAQYYSALKDIVDRIIPHKTTQDLDTAKLIFRGE